MPYLFGERPALGQAPGHGAIVGLSPFHTRVDIARSFLVALAFGLRRLLELIEPLAGNVELLTTSGGAGTTESWIRLRAAAYRRPLRTVATDPTALGALALGVSALTGAPADAIAGRLISQTAIVEPDQRLAAQLQTSYERHRALSPPALAPARA
jgi:xylulokinase